MPSLQELRGGYKQLLDKHYPDFVIGVDECGRGCIAGPMVVCAAAWFSWFDMPELKDSKKTSRTKIHMQADHLKSTLCIPYIMCICERADIDNRGIEACWQEAVSHAVQMLRWKYDNHETALVVIDGNRGLKWPTSAEHVHALPKADQYCQAVQAAAVIAKAYQLNLMKTYEVQYPGYGFEQHAGYKTKKHMEALDKLGPCSVHRKSFKLT